MLSSLLTCGFIFIIVLLTLYRYMDINIIYGLLLFVIVIEASMSWCTLSFISSTSSIIFLNLYSLGVSIFNINTPIVFIFDMITGYFHTILFITVFICYSFLLSYFKYDVNAVNIVLLSSLFSQLAFIYFCSYDIISCLFLWEYISIVSFLLIQFWSFRVTSLKASLKVFCISQVGDYLFITGLLILCYIFGTTNFSIILANKFLLIFYYTSICGFLISTNAIVSFCILSALFLKSAQFFFFPWLLDAMEAPVPISAQLHSSTLVIIGFYIVIRFYEILFYCDVVYKLCFLFSYLTIIGTSVLGFFQDDGKKLLACSTASQLGYVILSFSLGLFYEGLLLLLYCCCNKAFIFVWFGCIMDKNNGISDFRILKNLYWSYLDKAGLSVAVLSSTIIPGSFGWHIKSLLYRGMLVSDGYYTILGLEVLSLTWVFSSLYLYKLLYTILCIPSRGPSEDLNDEGMFFRTFFFKAESGYLLMHAVFFIVFLFLVPTCLSNGYSFYCLKGYFTIM